MQLVWTDCHANLPAHSQPQWDAVKAIVGGCGTAGGLQGLRAATEEFISEFKQVTSNLSDNVNAHVLSCQAAIDTFQAHHLKILNVDPPKQREVTDEEESNVVEALRHSTKPVRAVNLELQDIAVADGGSLGSSLPGMQLSLWFTWRWMRVDLSVRNASTMPQDCALDVTWQHFMNGGAIASFLFNKDRKRWNWK